MAIIQVDNLLRHRDLGIHLLTCGLVARIRVQRGGGELCGVAVTVGDLIGFGEFGVAHVGEKVCYCLFVEVLCLWLVVCWEGCWNPHLRHGGSYAPLWSGCGGGRDWFGRAIVMFFFGVLHRGLGW